MGFGLLCYLLLGCLWSVLAVNHSPINDGSNGGEQYPRMSCERLRDPGAALSFITPQVVSRGVAENS